MRVKRPEQFDQEREYNPGERFIYNGAILIANVWTKSAKKLAEDSKSMFLTRCQRCMLGMDVCFGTNIKCDKYRRSDRKTIYFIFAYPQRLQSKTINKLNK